MQINYKIKLKNPVAGSLQISNEYSQSGSFLVEKRTNGVYITGSVSKDNDIIKAYGHSYLGEDYSLTETDTLSLKTSDYTLADIEDVFEAIGKDVTTAEFKKLQPFLKRVIRTSTSFKVDVYVEKSTDIFLIKVDKEGLVTGLQGQVLPYSNSVALKPSTTVLASDTLLYVLTSKPLKLKTDEGLFISAQELLKAPQGFCTIGNQVFHKTTNKFETLGDYSTLISTLDTPLHFSSEIIVDGVKLLNTTVKAKEKVIIQTSDSLNKLSLNNLSDNVTLIYTITADNTPEPYLAVVGKELDLEYNPNIEQRLTELSLADDEFKKKYLFKEYKTLVNTDHNQYSIFNSKVLDTLLNTDEFLGCILKYEQ